MLFRGQIAGRARTHLSLTRVVRHGAVFVEPVFLGGYLVAKLRKVMLAMGKTPNQQVSDEPTFCFGTSPLVFGEPPFSGEVLRTRCLPRSRSAENSLPGQLRRYATDGDIAARWLMGIDAQDDFRRFGPFSKRSFYLFGFSKGQVRLWRLSESRDFGHFDTVDEPTLLTVSVWQPVGPGIWHMDQGNGWIHSRVPHNHVGYLALACD